MFGLTRKFKLSAPLEAALSNTYTHEEMVLIDGIGTQITVPAGSTIMVEGAQGAEALLLLDGTAAVSRGDEVIATVTTGDIVGEASLLTGEPRNATLIATTDLTAQVFNRREFAWLRLESPKFAVVTTELAEARA